MVVWRGAGPSILVWATHILCARRIVRHPNHSRENKKPLNLFRFNGFRAFLAERTGLEPATPGVTGRYSNQLNYRSRFLQQHL